MCIKKTLLYKERDEKKREEYLQQISCYDPENIVYIDESLNARMWQDHRVSKTIATVSDQAYILVF